jgi:hypothetical protein
MKRIHLLSVEGRAEEYHPLIAAIGADNRRVGWLDLTGTEVPDALRAASKTGVLRAVGVVDGLTVAAKPRKGGIVMKDLLREYFVGCSVVLVRGGEGMPRLSAAEGDWLVEVPGATPRKLDTASLVATLRRPRPFGA